MTKFGLSYNLFNAEEHFLPSLRNHRPYVDYINVVVQYKSNWGEEASEKLHESILIAKKDKLVDDVIEYIPDYSLHPQVNELKKRNIGLQHAKKKKVKYFMTIDADEYYIQDSFSDAIKYIKKNKILLTAAHSYLHIKRPIYRSKYPDTTCVCFFSSIEGIDKIVMSDFFPTKNIDPTRRINGHAKNFYMFPQEELSMMHMNLVRIDNLKSKLENTSSRNMVEFIDNVKSTYQNYKFGNILYFPNKPPMQIIKVPDYFCIDKMFKDLN